MAAVERVMQSQKQWLFESRMNVLFVHASIPRGGRGIAPNRLGLRLMTFLKRKRCVLLMPPTRDNGCFSRAVVVGLAWADEVSWKRQTQRNVGLRTSLARALQRRTGIPLGLKCGPQEWRIFQARMGPAYSLIIVSSEAFNSIVYWGNPCAKAKRVCLYLADDHYHVITSICAFMGGMFVCPYCLGKSRSLGLHTCDKTCYYCKSSGMCVVGERVECKRCLVTHPSRPCYEEHLAKDLCAARALCALCAKMHSLSRPHTCHVTYCSKCKTKRPVDHLCYMQPLAPPKREKKRDRYLFYDFECQALKEKAGLHVPNLCVSHLVCTDCMHLPMTEHCDCERESRTFDGPDTLKDFCEYVLDGRKAGCVCLAHNASAYDTHFVLSYIHSAGVLPEVVGRGRKIMSLQANGVKFIDSLNFMPMSLSKLPKAFDLRELKKGYFPHLMNTPDNQNYVGEFPPADLYDPDGMKAEGREDFFKWHAAQAGKVFDFKSEILAYCKSDVDILQRAAGTFRKIFMEVSKGVEPFKHSLTLSAACMRVFRTNYLKPNTVALISPHGYYYGQQSAIAVTWLISQSLDLGVHIRHYANSGEVRVEGRFVDGVDTNGVLYFFHGDMYHGCPLCYPDRDAISPLTSLTMRELYDRTMRHMESLERKGYVVIQKWECAFMAEIKDRPELQAIRDQNRHLDHLTPRECLYGGRTCPIKLYQKAGPGERMRYVDFVSLYPHVNYRCCLPLGHPRVFTGADIPARVEGLLKCKVLPPQRLFIPVLPYRCRGKLLFPLCRTCAELALQTQCPHTDPASRCLTGAWVTLELDRAVAEGYVILERYEAWHYEKFTTYDQETGKGGILAGYVRECVKLKQEASGYPTEAVTAESKEAYLREHKRVVGIELDPTKIKKNESLRTVAKVGVFYFWAII